MASGERRAIRSGLYTKHKSLSIFKACTAVDTDTDRLRLVHCLGPDSPTRPSLPGRGRARPETRPDPNRWGLDAGPIKVDPQGTGLLDAGVLSFPSSRPSAVDNGVHKSQALPSSAPPPTLFKSDIKVP